jgi:hypothetical protein
VFGRKITRAPPGPFRTTLITREVDPSLSIFYKHSKLKQYLKDGKAVRTELTINDPATLRSARASATSDLSASSASTSPAVSWPPNE